MGHVGDQRRAGQGLMREATLAVIALCCQLGFERIKAMSDARNARALHFAETLGLQREGLLRRHERDGHGQLYDMVLYAILAPAQPAANRRSATLAQDVDSPASQNLSEDAEAIHLEQGTP